MHESRIPWLRRSSAFVRKEIVEVVRQPRLLLTLVLGPFLLLLVFGLGFIAQPPSLRATIMSPPDLDPDVMGQVERALDPVVTVVGTSETEAAAEEAVLAGAADLAILIPDDPMGRLRSQERIPVSILHSEFDPFRRTYIALSASSAVDQVNAMVLESTLADAREQLAGIPGLGELDPGILVRPFQAETRSVGAVDLSVAGYAPAVIVLLLQHLAVAFGSLTLVRERSLGTSEFFRVSPLSTGETLIGKFAAYLVLGGVVGLLLTIGVETLFSVPMRGSWAAYSIAMLLLLFASAGLGLLISAVSAGESQAVQWAMLVLLATMFFSGFIIPLDQLQPFAKVVSAALPAAYGIAIAQDVMIRGTVPTGLLIGLGALGMAYFLASWVLVRRILRPLAAKSPKSVMARQPAAPPA